MAKMHLPARVPNRGAHLLAWVLGNETDPEAAVAELDRRIGTGMVDRILSGDVVPASVLARDVFTATRGKVEDRDWRRPSSGRWGDAPAGWRRQPSASPIMQAPAGYQRRVLIDGATRLGLTTAALLPPPARRKGR